MAQIEVFNYLKNMRRSGDNSYLSIPELTKSIRQHKLYSLNSRGVWAAVVTMEAYGYLDVKRKGKLSNWQRCVRLKKKYVNNI